MKSGRTRLIAVATGALAVCAVVGIAAAGSQGERGPQADPVPLKTSDAVENSATVAASTERDPATYQGQVAYTDYARETQVIMMIEPESPAGAMTVFGNRTTVYLIRGEMVAEKRPDGSTAYSYTGEATRYEEDEFDEESPLDFMAMLYGLSGDRVIVTVEGELSADLAEARFTLTGARETLTLESIPAPKNADVVAGQVAAILESGRLEELVGLLAPQEHVSTDEFLDILDEFEAIYFGDRGNLLEVGAGPILYKLNPVPGAQVAMAELLVQFDDGGRTVEYHLPVSLGYAGADGWQVGLFYSYVEDRSLQFTQYPLQATAGERMPIAPEAAIVVHHPSVEFDDNFTRVALSIADGPAGATLTCGNGVMQRVESGVVDFGRCSVDLPGTYTLAISSDGMRTVVGDAFEVGEPTP